MTSNWQALSLQEANVTLTDCDHRTPPPATEGYPYVAIPQMQSGRLVLSGARKISKEHFVEWTRKASPLPNDVVLSRRCNPGETAFVAEGMEFALGQNLVLLRADGTKVFPPFLRWLVMGPEWWNQVRKFINVGAVFDSLKCADIPRFQLTFPPLPEQRAIARILGALDDKIELNRRQNATLEELARAIFKSWFVDFDPVRARAEGRAPAAMDAATAALFPDGFEEIDGREVPRGWRYVPLKEFLTLKRGYDLPQVQREAGTVPIVSSSGVSGTHSIARVAGPGVVTGRYGTIGQVFFIEEHFWPLNTTLYVQDFKQNEPRIAHYVLSNINFTQFTDKAAVPGINRNHVHEEMVVLPDIDVQRAFTQLTEPFFKQGALNTAQNITLATLRDALLPRLLSGELRVREAERLVEERV